ncbi:hypothetical protein DBR47_24145 [Paucibacter sp. KBW04]|uniref:ChaN family lipoprotein n=1 Tax=Paucibacter sp. KBW04 TaxID=2153361 RepID=UPI000F589D79|nr:ChaN family lipoprotein [Paucibacter sp. KBW04]RQO53406.1 hypothetical protein DBR47_24145 [Paucibacter sp. KBW04]
MQKHSVPRYEPTRFSTQTNWLRIVLGLALGTCLLACANQDKAQHSQGTPAKQKAEANIVEVASGRSISRGELLQLMRKSDFVLLGEKHDNPNHHIERGALLRELGPSPVIIAEHLPSSAQLRPKPSDELLNELNKAGFAAKQWQWPVHQPLFAGVAQAGQSLQGGNISRDLARQLAREGRAAMPTDLLSLTEAAPLAPVAQAALEADLIEGHCGQLPSARLAGMIWAQRARDAAMAQRMIQAYEQGAKPAVLVAGNGHVRRDYGVPQLLQKQLRQSRLLSVGFLEPDAPSAGAPYDYVWISAAPGRDDPCAGFLMPTNSK